MSFKNPFQLEDKLIIVTGASSGIGKACAVLCSQLGATVILLARNEDRLKGTYSELTKNKKHEYYSVELTDYNKVEKVVEQIFEKHGKINGLLNAAGISTTMPLKIIKNEQLEEFFSINVISSINLTKCVTKKKYFAEEGGSIIFISSVMGVVGEIGKTTYSLTKGALISGARSLALELSSRKIRVNCISPGVVETPMSQNAVYGKDEVMFNRVKSQHPLGPGKAEDVANACIFLLSDSSRWITGTNLIIDGGYTAR
ncbi:MAG: SDR family oxidoreductase [Ignavibacteria bacterium]|jgi:NAD(P)-dependent dehydrogenase (short-subunit alcohol dehydrogenase family)